MRLLLFLILGAALAIACRIAAIRDHARLAEERAAAERREAAVQALAAEVGWRAAGRQEAEWDIAAGRMKVRTYGYMAGIGPEADRLRRRLRNRYGLELEAVAQCVVSEELVERVRGYNGRIREQVARTFGDDAAREAFGDPGEREWPELQK
jgi:hypothetical protein